MSRRGLSTWVIFAAFSATAAFAADLPSAWRAWRYSRLIQSQPAVSPGLCNAHLPVDVFPHARNSVADLRIIDESGAEVPYSLNAEAAGKKTESRRAELRENSYVAGQYTQALLDLGKQASFHNAVRIATPESNFINWVEVAASDEARVWRIVKARAPISRFQRENLEGNQTVHYSQNNARYLRLRIFETERQFPITGADVYFNTEAPEPEREAVPLNLAADLAAPKTVTRWTADCDSSCYPVSEVAFDTRQSEFYRAVRVQRSEDANDWIFAGAGEIYRYEVGDKLEESLRVRLNGLPASRYWRVEVVNQNDSPLEAVSARFLMNSRKVLWEQKPGRSYLLLYGNSRAETPHYDLERRLGVDARIQSVSCRAEIGPEELTANYADARPFTERHPNLLWLILAFAVVLLGYAAVRALKAPVSPPS